MKRSLIWLVLLLSASMMSGPLAAQQTGAGPAVLTIAGAITNSNRDPFDETRDVFFKFHDRTFQKAYAFDLAALRALPQKTVTARAEGWPAPQIAKGPLLRAILNAAGAKSDASITVFALDGYAAELKPSELEPKEWVLALEMDGKPLGLGGHGPAWLVYESSNSAVSAQVAEKWVWSVFFISVQ